MPVKSSRLGDCLSASSAGPLPAPGPSHLTPLRVVLSLLRSSTGGCIGWLSTWKRKGQLLPAPHRLRGHSSFWVDPEQRSALIRSLPIKGKRNTFQRYPVVLIDRHHPMTVPAQYRSMSTRVEVGASSCQSRGGPCLSAHLSALLPTSPVRSHHRRWSVHSQA